MNKLLLSCRSDIDAGTYYDNIEDPSWFQIEERIKKMNDINNEVVLEIQDQEFPALLLGGGQTKRYIVTFIPENYLAENSEGAYQLVDRSQSNDEFIAIVGAQETPLPGRWYVSQKVALQATEYFFKNAARDPQLKWERPGAENRD